MARIFQGNQNIVLEGIANPVADTDAANKTYVDTADSGLGNELAYVPLGHADHSGDDNEGEIVLAHGAINPNTGELESSIIYRLPIDVETLAAAQANPNNGFFKQTDSAGDPVTQFIMQLSSMVQADDNRPVTAAAVQTAIAAIVDNNTTYTFANGTDGTFTVTPSDTGTAQTVSVGVAGGAISVWPSSFTSAFTVPANSIWFYNDEYWILQSDTDVTIQTSGDYDTDSPSEFHLSWRQLTGEVGDWPASFTTAFVLHHDALWTYQSNLWLYKASFLNITTAQQFADNTPNSTDGNWLQISGGAGGIQVVTTDPSSPTEGDVWYNSTDDQVKWYDGTSTHIVADRAYVNTAVAGEATLRSAADTAEATARSNADTNLQDEIDEIEQQLTRNPSDSEFYYRFEGVPESFTNTGGDSEGSVLAFDDDFSIYEELTRSATLAGNSSPISSTKVILKYGSNANEFREYLLVYGNNGSFYIADDSTVAHYTLEHLEDGYVFYSAASSGATNGGVTGLYESKLWLGNSRGGVVEIPHGSLFDSNGNLAGRQLPRVTPQGDSDYYEVFHPASGDNSDVTGLDYFYNGAGNAALIVGYRNGRVFRLRDSGTTISFDEGGILVAEMGNYTIPTSSTFTANKFNIIGIKSFTLDGADALTNGPTFDNGSRLYVIYGDTVETRSANFPIPGIAIANNLHSITDAEFSSTGTARVPGGNDPSEQYVGYTGNSATFDPELDMRIYDVDYYSDSGTDQYLLFVGGQNNVGPTEQAQMWYCDIDENSLWQPERLPSNNYKAAIGAPIYSVSHGPSISSSGNGVWLGTGNGAVWSIPNDTANLSNQSGTVYADDKLLQVLTDPSDASSAPLTTGNILGFDVFGITQDDQETSVYAAGVNSDGHVIRWDLNPDITVTIRHANIDHVATFNYTGNESAVQTFFADRDNFTPNLPAAINISTTQPSEQPAGQLYIDYSVSDGDIPGITVTHTGALIATDAAFPANRPWRTFSEEATTVTVTFPDGGFVFTTTLSSATADATAQRAVEQIRDTLNQNAHGISAEVLDEDFNPSITMTTPVLRIDQPGVVAFSNRPMISIVNNGDHQISQALTGSLQVNANNDLILTNLQLAGVAPTQDNPLILPASTTFRTAGDAFVVTITDSVVITSNIRSFVSGSYTFTGTAPSVETPFQNTTVFIEGGGLSANDFADGAFDTIGQEGGLFNPNDYYTRPQINAKIDAIEVMQGTGGGTTVIANTGVGNTDYPDLTTLQIGTDIYDVPDTNTTYAFANGTNGTFTVTPAGGSAQTVSVGVTASDSFRIHEGWVGYFNGTLTGNSYSAGDTPFVYNTGDVRTLLAYDAGADSITAIIPEIREGNQVMEVVLVADLGSGVAIFQVSLQSGQDTVPNNASRHFDTVLIDWQPDETGGAQPTTATNTSFALLSDIRGLTGNVPAWVNSDQSQVALSGFNNDAGFVTTDTNTTYTFASGTNGSFTVTPSGGAAQTVMTGGSGGVSGGGIVDSTVYVDAANTTATLNETSGFIGLRILGVLSDSFDEVTYTFSTQLVNPDVITFSGDDVTTIPSGNTFTWEIAATDLTFVEGSLSGNTNIVAGDFTLTGVALEEITLGSNLNFDYDTSTLSSTDTNTTYTFGNGTNGSFTVTPTGGSAQTISTGGTTYTFASGTNGSFTVTPSGGSAQTISTGSGAAGSLTIQTEGYVAPTAIAGAGYIAGTVNQFAISNHPTAPDTSLVYILVLEAGLSIEFPGSAVITSPGAGSAVNWNIPTSGIGITVVGTIPNATTTYPGATLGSGVSFTGNTVTVDESLEIDIAGNLSVSDSFASAGTEAFVPNQDYPVDANFTDNNRLYVVVTAIAENQFATVAAALAANAVVELVNGSSSFVSVGATNDITDRDATYGYTAGPQLFIINGIPQDVTTGATYTLHLSETLVVSFAAADVSTNDIGNTTRFRWDIARADFTIISGVFPTDDAEYLASNVQLLETITPTDQTSIFIGDGLSFNNGRIDNIGNQRWATPDRTQTLGYGAATGYSYFITEDEYRLTVDRDVSTDVAQYRWAETGTNAVAFTFSPEAVTSTPSALNDGTFNWVIRADDFSVNVLSGALPTAGIANSPLANVTLTAVPIFEYPSVTAGTGLDFDVSTGTLSVSSFAIEQTLRPQLILTGGFTLLQEITNPTAGSDGIPLTHTVIASADYYRDVNNHLGTSNQVYIFTNDTSGGLVADSWYELTTGSVNTLIISFI